MCRLLVADAENLKKALPGVSRHPKTLLDAFMFGTAVQTQTAIKSAFHFLQNQEKKANRKAAELVWSSADVCACSTNNEADALIFLQVSHLHIPFNVL